MTNLEANTFGEKVRPYFLGSRGGQVYNMSFSDMNLQILPGIYSEDKSYQDFLVDISNTLSSKFKPSETENGIFVTAPIESDFSKLKTMPGSIRKLSYNPQNVVHNIKSMNLEEILLDNREEKDDEFLSVLRKVVKVRYSYKGEHQVKISKMSSSGAPFFLNEVDLKLDHLNLLSNNIDRFKKLLGTVALPELYEEFKVVFLSTAQVRKQNDSWKNGRPKSRRYSGYVDAYNNVSNVYAPKEEMYNDELARSRTRVVYAYPSVTNYVLTANIVDIRDEADRVFSFTYKHRTGEEVVKKISKFNTYIGLDVKQFDSNIKFSWFIQWLLSLPVSDYVRRLALLQSLSPFYSSETKMASGDPMVLEDFKFWGGLPSGVAFTSMLGKDIMTSVVLYGIQKTLNRKLTDSELIEFLKGDYVVGLLNQSDDSVLMTKEFDEELLLTIIHNMNDLLQVEVENGLRFLGNNYYIDRKEGKREINYAPSMISYFEKVYVPERGIDSKLRPYPIFGITERRKLYARHPFFEEVRSIERDLFKFHFHEDLDVLEEGNLVVPKDIGAIKESDLDVLSDFSKLYYKYDLDNINHKIWERYIAVMPNALKDKLSL